ncbi:septation protein SepH [Arthrobacter sp. Br18]|uniref:septation protein SepH n=1 Tax=Arthrobacter sp. Br18 TaxID=1312954 RepID=UPI00047DFF98|nr:septation protein SepH [Arthrobacter sp. Br18]
MQELRLVGVHEDGAHLLLGGDTGTTFRLPINEALRIASTRPSTRVAPVPPTTGQAAVHFTPKDIQSRIRSGASAEEVAAESGLELNHVLRYEGPVRAERDYMAYLAQRVEVASPVPSHDGYRSVSGNDAAQLGDMVTFRLQAYGIDPAGVEWDSWRRTDGVWLVVARFALPEGSTVAIGEDPPAQWTFNPRRRILTNANRWAQVLSELVPLDGPLPSRRLSAVADRVFDFEAEKDDDGPSTEGTDPDGLLDVLRSRRGQRLGADEDGDDALAELLAKGSIPAAHPRDGEDDEDVADRAAADKPASGLGLAPALPADDSGPTHHEDGSPKLYDGVSGDTREISIFAEPVRAARKDPGTSAVPNPAASDSRAEKAQLQKGFRPAGSQGSAPARNDEPTDRRIKPKRSSVPSWDQIVFGTKGD